MDDEILATVEASTLRRWIGVAMLTAMGGLVIYVALARPPSLGWQLFLLVAGAASLWMADRMRRATEHRIELTTTELRATDGTCIARIDEIDQLDRGAFAFKPSNGFLIRTRGPAARVWRPGLWWRMGRRIGIGGVTPGSQTKVMSEILDAMLAQRDQTSDHAT